MKSSTLLACAVGHKKLRKMCGSEIIAARETGTYSHVRISENLKL